MDSLEPIHPRRIPIHPLHDGTPECRCPDCRLGPTVRIVERKDMPPDMIALIPNRRAGESLDSLVNRSVIGRFQS